MEFIASREQDRALIRAAAAVSAPGLPPSGMFRKTTHTMAYEFGDVVILPFPFTNQTAFKKRPAVIVSNAAYNRAKQDVVVMAITSQRMYEKPQRMFF